MLAAEDRDLSEAVRVIRSSWVPFGIAVLTFLLASPAGISVSKLPPPTLAGDGGTSHYRLAWGPGQTHLDHVITVVMENRVYDNYFGEYCRTVGPYCSSTGNGIPAGTCIPRNPSNQSLGCVVPFNLTTSQFVTSDMPHTWTSGLAAWDHGAMDGFYVAEGTDGQPLGHYNASTLPIYWDMAEQYAISDNLFAANLSYSLPNHWYLVAGQAPNITQSSLLQSDADRALYLNQSNQTRTIQDVLNHSSVSWMYYDFALPTWAKATQTGGSAYDFWNPMGARAESYSSEYAAHFAPRSQFLDDVANGTLPQISWVVPFATQSDHPGWNVTAGESWVAQLVNAVEASPEWNSTAIFVVWDDYGGWYDHVAPPWYMAKLLSFRSPAIVISPYAKENYISHQFLTFFSLLRFVEWQFKLGCMTPLDCAATLPFDFFDFNQTARPPMYFPTDWTQATYPMRLQTAEYTLPDDRSVPNCLACVTISPANWVDGAPPPRSTSLGD